MITLTGALTALSLSLRRPTESGSLATIQRLATAHV